MKRIFSVALAAALVWLPVPAAHGVGTSASSAVLMDAGSGRTILNLLLVFLILLGEEKIGSSNIILRYQARGSV
ncbi:MAG: hypothetical protein HFF38_09950, partial [Lawsonibacter sp.]|nr:hypothetical protein [Lawsonibacter sp.]